MAMSGVTLADNVVSAMNDVRMKRTRYAILKIGEDGKQIQVAEVGPRETTYEQFCAKISPTEPCYAAYDYEYVDANGTSKAKVLTIQWVPDVAKPRAKMLYSSSRDALTSVTEGFLSVQANDASELEPAELLRKIQSHRSN